MSATTGKCISQLFVLNEDTSVYFIFNLCDSNYTLCGTGFTKCRTHITTPHGTAVESLTYTLQEEGSITYGTPVGKNTIEVLAWGIWWFSVCIHLGSWSLP